MTTVHSRTDVRIRIKEVNTLAHAFPADVRLFVQDGEGDETDLAGYHIVDTGPRLSRLVRMSKGGWRMFNAVRRARPTVVQFHDPELIPWALLLSLYGVLVVYDVHEDVPRQIRHNVGLPKWLRYLLSPVVELVEWFAGRSFAAVVAATPEIAARFPARRTILVWNYPPLSEFPEAVGPPMMERDRRFIYLGGLSRIRGLFSMVEAMGRLGDSEATLHLAGDFTASNDRLALEQAPGAPRVRYHGWLQRDEVGPFLAGARAGLVTLAPIRNYVEARPVKLFEYMAAGLPVIASDFPRWREIIGSVDCGLLVDPTDPDAIAAAMQWVLDHPEKAEAMGARGRDAVVRQYNWQGEGAKLVQLYRLLLGREIAGASSLPSHILPDSAHLPRPVVAHMTSAHPRSDTRIRLKEVASVARALDADVILFVQDGLGDESDPGGYRIVDTGRTPPTRLGRLFEGGWRMMLAVRRFRPAVVQFHDPELLPWALLLQLTGVKIIYDVHEDLPRQIRHNPHMPRWLRPFLPAVASTAEWVAARIFSAQVAATPEIAARFPGKTTALVQNYPMIGELHVTEQIPMAARPVEFAYVGGMSADRGIMPILRALDQLPGTVTLAIAGTFGIAQEQATAQAHRGWHRVRFLGFQNREEVANLLSRTRAGLVLFQPLPNNIAGRPNKLFEYMSAGLPVIASDYPLWREIVGGANCGLLVDPTDPDAIAAAMQWVLDHPEEAQMMGERGRLAILHRYNWEPEAGKLVGLYATLLPSVVEKIL